MQAQILTLQKPLTHAVGSKVHFFTENSHVAYQIEGDGT